MLASAVSLHPQPLDLAALVVLVLQHPSVLLALSLLPLPPQQPLSAALILTVAVVLVLPTLVTLLVLPFTGLTGYFVVPLYWSWASFFFFRLTSWLRAFFFAWRLDTSSPEVVLAAEAEVVERRESTWAVQRPKRSSRLLASSPMVTGTRGVAPSWESISSMSTACRSVR